MPIKPIPRCITFAEDINSYKCRDQLRENLKDWRADVVLHDGAPNVGTAWVQDAYAQSELTLQALRLAVEFLAPGGTFVTKVFRSKDYNNLVWVFNQLFHHVEATKPPSSRNVSAEIFVVCQRFKNMTRIDPRFLDPKFVFKELEPGVGLKDMAGASSHNLLENVVHPEKVRRKREGYEDGNYTLYKTLSATDYIHGTDAIAMLGTYNRITFDTEEDKALLTHRLTTEDVRINCEDLKVLGRRDFALLMKWRKAMRENLGIDRTKKQQKEDAQATETVEIEPLDEEEAMDDELLRLNEEAAKRTRKERRKRNEARAKTIQKLQLNMTTPMDIAEEWQDDALHGGTETFSLDALERGPPGSRGVQNTAEFLDAEEALSDEESEHDIEEEESDSEDDDKARRIKELESGMDTMYEKYQEHLESRDAKFRAKEARRKSSKYEEWGGIGADKKDDESDDESDAGVAKGFDSVNRRKFEEETYDSDDEEDDEDERAEAEENQPHTKQRAKPRARAPVLDSAQKQALLTTLESGADLQKRQSSESAMWYDNPIFKDMIPMEALVPEDQASTPELSPEEAMDEDEEDGDEIDVVPSSFAAEVPEGEWSVYDEDVEAAKQARIAKHGLHTAEAVSMAHALVNRQMTKTELVNQGFNKHNFNEKTGLPEWFLDDEGKHYRTNLPITKEAVDALRAKQRALDARPIRKVAEAKARKKHRAVMRLEKAKKRADAINENADLTEREKSENINKILSKSMAKKAGSEKKLPQLVVARGANRGLKGRPKGTKGRYRMLDPRMKKEVRAKKRIDKRDGKKTSSSNKKRRIPNGY